MEPIIYRPYGFCRLLACLELCLAIGICMLSYYFILPALLLLIPVYFLFRAGKVMLVMNQSGILLLNEKTAPSRFLTWDELKCYQLTNNLRGQDVVLLSSAPLEPGLARRYANAASLSRTTNLWVDGILIIPLFFVGNNTDICDFIHQKTAHR